MARHGIMFAGAAVVLLAASSCSRRDSRVVKREGEPDYVRVSDQTRMDRAMAEARSTIDNFVAALAARTPGTMGFAVKKGYPCPGDAKEFIWINEVGMDGDVFVGTVNNEPVDTKQVRLGQKVRVKRGEIADWMYLERGRLRGGYTIVALVHGTPQQNEYGKNLQIDWSDYEFLGGKE